MRFRLARHLGGRRGDHHDLFLDDGGGDLRTFALPASLWPAGPFPVRELPPHRRVYLTFVGEIPGNGWLEDADAGGCVALGPLAWQLEGAAVRGVLALTPAEEEGTLEGQFSPVP